MGLSCLPLTKHWLVANKEWRVFERLVRFQAKKTFWVDILYFLHQKKSKKVSIRPSRSWEIKRFWLIWKLVWTHLACARHRKRHTHTLRQNIGRKRTWKTHHHHHHHLQITCLQVYVDRIAPSITASRTNWLCCQQIHSLLYSKKSRLSRRTTYDVRRTPAVCNSPYHTYVWKRWNTKAGQRGRVFTSSCHVFMSSPSPNLLLRMGCCITVVAYGRRASR